MLLTPDSVELLAPAGTWDALAAAVDAGADAVYLGGKRFNMRQHRTDVNFDDEKLRKAVEFAHSRNVRLYITVNNLISSTEIDVLRGYLTLLENIQPDALIIQDPALLQLTREMGLTIPLHASVMMNTHNEHAVRTLQEYGITRVVANREMTLSQLRLLKERTGIEVEYFVHGDMCISHSGQCIHSGVLFGQSSNRGRCLKPCRWPFQLVDDRSDEVFDAAQTGPYKLAMKDMCMYTALPELIQSGVCSFKIEGRMRTPDFVHRIVRIYRRAIDRYLADPTGYCMDPEDWRELYDYRSRDFSTCYALGNPGASSIGYDGSREPRFFSQAVREADITSTPLPLQPKDSRPAQASTLAVRVADPAGVAAACANGAQIIYAGGEAFHPYHPWTLAELETAAAEAAAKGARLIVTTPRITMERECGELEQMLHNVEKTGCHGLLVSNSGMLRLARQLTSLPVQADLSFNLFNHLTAAWLQDNGAAKATVSLEATYEQISQMSHTSPIPLEVIVHGAMEAMILDHCLLTASLNPGESCHELCRSRQYALLDTAGQKHRIRIDQYCRNHILFARDLCLLPHLAALSAAGISHYRIEAQHYTPEQAGLVTRMYHQELEKIQTGGASYRFDPALTGVLSGALNQDLGIGAFRYRISR
ncbi:MAG TPA: U32 family peptidase [Patescibacteria group bacterium]|nr:U32 family peptidase [Patescibacteria group bacterium]